MIGGGHQARSPGDGQSRGHDSGVGQRQGRIAIARLMEKPMGGGYVETERSPRPLVMWGTKRSSNVAQEQIREGQSVCSGSG